MKIPSAPPDMSPGPWRMMHLREQPRNDFFLVWWLGQSGFGFRYREEMAVIDPYLSDSLTKKYARTEKPHVRIKPIFIEPNWLAQSLVTVVAATHQHTDHLDPETLRPMADRFRAWGAPFPLIAPEAWRSLAAERAGIAESEIIGIDDGMSVRQGSFEFVAIPSAHEAVERDEAGHCKYLGYVLRFGDWSVYHSGDTLFYEGLIERLRPFELDLAILPINGKVGNMNGATAARLAKEIGARLVIPCHYDMFEFNTADPADEFIPECERIGQAYRVLQLGERFSSSEISR